MTTQQMVLILGFHNCTPYRRSALHRFRNLYAHPHTPPLKHGWAWQFACFYSGFKFRLSYA